MMNTFYLSITFPISFMEYKFSFCLKSKKQKKVRMPQKLIDVVAGLIYKQDKILLCRRKEGKQQAGFWEFPGGKIEKGESKKNALLREISEELGITITIDCFFGQTTYHYPNISIRLWAYKCLYKSGEINLIDHDRFVWATKKAITSFQLSPADIEIAQKVINT